MTSVSIISMSTATGSEILRVSLSESVTKLMYVKE